MPAAVLAPAFTAIPASDRLSMWHCGDLCEYGPFFRILWMNEIYTDDLRGTCLDMHEDRPVVNQDLSPNIVSSRVTISPTHDDEEGAEGAGPYYQR